MGFWKRFFRTIGLIKKDWIWVLYIRDGRHVHTEICYSKREYVIVKNDASYKLEKVVKGLRIK